MRVCTHHFQQLLYVDHLKGLSNQWYQGKIYTS